MEFIPVATMESSIFFSACPSRHATIGFICSTRFLPRVPRNPVAELFSIAVDLGSLTMLFITPSISTQNNFAMYSH